MPWLIVTLRGAGGEVWKTDMPLYPTTLQKHSNNMYGFGLEFRFFNCHGFKSSLKSVQTWKKSPGCQTRLPQKHLRLKYFSLSETFLWILDPRIPTFCGLCQTILILILILISVPTPTFTGGQLRSSPAHQLDWVSRNSTCSCFPFLFFLSPVLVSQKEVS